MLGPQPSTSTAGVIPASSGVAGSAGVSGFVAGAAAGKPHPSISTSVSAGAAAELESVSAAQEQLLLPGEVTFEIIRHTDDVTQW